MRIAILGGSFNPIHIGHLFLGDAVISALHYDRVILVPAFQSPFKPFAEGASPLDRLEMAAASISGDPRFAIDDCEIKREGVSYTIDTIAEIKKRYRPAGKPGLILGDDLVSTFSNWNRAAEIANEADIIIARRFNDPAHRIPVQDFPYSFTGLHNELIRISSALVRDKIRQSENWRYLVPSGASYIIEDRGLYGFVKSAVPWRNNVSKETLVLIENEARKILNFTRYLHSRNTALMARDLCVNYWLDPQAGYLAGIAHDMCKSMKEEELLRLAGSDGREITTLDKKKPSLLHGRAAAVMLERKYGISDKEILDAISCHVTCGKNMSDLAKVLYIADKIEVSREWVSLRGFSPANIREMCVKTDLDEIFMTVLEDTVTFLKSRKKEVSYNAQKLLSSMKKRKKNEKKSKS